MFFGSAHYFQGGGIMLKQSKVLCMGVAMLIMVFVGYAYADNVTDAVNEALQHYKGGNYSEAMNSLNYASQLIGQKKGGNLQSLLPEPLQGWTAEDTKSEAVQMYGGGVTAERRYRKDESSVSVRIITDSPMLQGVMMMLSNPMMATSDGGKMVKIGGEKAIVKYNASKKRGDINIVIANRFMVTVEGKKVELEDLKAYAAAIDYKKLSALP
jgi:hypothetical protein